jgi:NitT/TauT family transport system substrate-binding protein
VRPGTSQSGNCSRHRLTKTTHGRTVKEDHLAPIRVGINEGTGKIYANVTLLAYGRGHFKREGVDVQLMETGGRRATIPLLVSGELEVGAQSPTYEFFESWDDTRPMPMVADHGSVREGRGGAGGIVARPELVASGELRDFADLKGKRVGLSPRRYDHDWVTVSEALERGGLTVNDINVVNMSFGDVRREALVKGEIDLTTVDRPVSIKEGKESGAFVVWKHEYEIRPGRQQRAVMFGHQFWSQRPDEAERYVRAHIRALREYFDAFERGIDRDRVIDVLAEQCGDSRAVVEETMPAGVNPDGHINVAAIARDLHWYQDGGFLPTTLSVERCVDHRYVEAALKELGPHVR